jgi:hypothetical protein
MTEAINAIRLTFGALHTDHAQAPQRLAADLPENSLALLMLSLLQTNQHHLFGLKVVTIVSQNLSSRGGNLLQISW